MGLFSLKPARTQYTAEDVKVVADLDALIAQPVGFKLNGKTHVIKPVTTEQFFNLITKLEQLDTLKRKIAATSDIDENEFVKAYHEVFSVACDTMTKDDLYQMTHAQRAALLQIILQAVGGTAQVDQAQKKNPLSP